VEKFKEIHKKQQTIANARTAKQQNNKQQTKIAGIFYK
jgi:hypothetical protein